MHVRKNDTVAIIAGEDTGKRGKVLRVFPDEGKVLVEGVNFVYKHLRRSAQHPQGGRIERESSLSISNVKLICSHCGKPSGQRKKILGNGEKVRICTECGEVIAASRK